MRVSPHLLKFTIYFVSSGDQLSTVFLPETPLLPGTLPCDAHCPFSSLGFYYNYQNSLRSWRDRFARARQRFGGGALNRSGEPARRIGRNNTASCAGYHQSPLLDSLLLMLTRVLVCYAPNG